MTEKTHREYDPEIVKEEVVVVCDHYLPRVRRDGKRHVYNCPECDGERFEVEPIRGIAGCFTSGCSMPTSTDAIGIIAHMESLERRGAGFVSCMQKGYEIIGLEAATASNGNGSASNASGEGEANGKSRSWVAGGSQQNNGNSQSTDQGQPATELDTQPVPEGYPTEAYVKGADGEWEVAEAFIISDGDTGSVPIQTEPDIEEAATIQTPDEAGSQQGGNRQGSSQGDKSRQAGTGHSDYQRRLTHNVYSAMLDLCKCEERDYAYFEGRGVDRQTVDEGRFASLSRKRAPYVGKELARGFSEEELLSVPGFFKSKDGTLRFSIYGNYALFPYYDGDGYIVSVEGRLTGKSQSPKDHKYKAPLDGGVNLYLHPRHSPRQIVAICEGAVGAMVAAAHGLAVASIKGMYCYRQAPMERGGEYKVLPQLAGVDFAGKTVVYIPDIDVKPESYEEAMGLVPDACRWLIERQGGVAKVAMLPEGAKDLDDWLLGMDQGERVRRFYELLVSAEGIEEWSSRYLAETDDSSRSDDNNPGCTQPEGETLEEDSQGQMVIGISGEDDPAATDSGQRDEGGSEQGNIAGAAQITFGGSSSTDDGTREGESRGPTGNGEDASEKQDKKPSVEHGSDRSSPNADGSGNHQEANAADMTMSASAKKTTDGATKGPMDEESAWWYQVAATTDEEVEEIKQLVKIRDEAGYSRPTCTSVPLRLRRWTAGEVIVTAGLCLIVAVTAAVLAHLATDESGLVGLAGWVLTWPVWWSEAVMFTTFGLLVALAISRVRYRKHHKRLAQHLRGERDTG